MYMYTAKLAPNIIYINVLMYIIDTHTTAYGGYPYAATGYYGAGGGAYTTPYQQQVCVLSDIIYST